jgi:hypothetical protein
MAFHRIHFLANETPSSKSLNHFCMKIRYSSLPLAIIAGLTLIWFLSPRQHQLEAQKLSKMQRIDKAIEQEYAKTKDLATGEVPRERLLAARNYADRLRSQPPSSRAALANVTWDERGPDNVSGRTRAVLIDANDRTGNTVWAGGVGGGLWKTTNALANSPNWTPINDLFENMAISCIAQDPNNANIIYFGTGEGWFNADAIRGLGVWKTTNGGTTWNRLTSTNGSTWYYCMKMVIDANSNVFVTTGNGGLQRSTNGGANWSKVLGSGAVASTNRAADVEIASNGDMYCSMGVFNRDGVYKSTNGGTTWSKLTGNGFPASGYQRIELAVAPSNASRVYALLQDGSRNCGWILRTDNGGNSWISMTVPGAVGMSNFCRGQAWYDLIAAVDPNNPDRIYIGGIDVLLSSDGGSTWTQVGQWYGGGGIQYVHADQHMFVFQPGNSSLAFFANDGGLYRSTNANAANPTIRGIYDDYNVTQYYACDLHPGAGVNEFIAGAQDNGTQRYTSAGMNSTNEVTGGDGAFCHIDQDQPNIQISSYVYNAYRITNNSWASHRRLTIGSNAGSFINPTDYDSDNNVLYGTYSNGQYSLVTNVGNTNTTGTRSISQFNNGRATSVRVSPNVANRVYFGLNNGEVVRVDNANGANPTGTIVRNGSGSVSCVTVEVGNEDHILITYSNYGRTSVYETTNGGSNWTSIEGNIPDMPVRWIEFAPGNNDQALIATELGVWSTDDINGGATNWGPTNGGLANTRVDMLAWRSSDNLMIAATHGRGLYSTDDLGATGPGCNSPTSRTVNPVGTTTATLNWATINGAVNYEIRYRQVGAANWTIVNTVTGTSYNLNGLLSSSSYEWQIRTNCGTGFSAWISGPGFTTSFLATCVSTITTYPYAEGFENGISWYNVADDDFDWVTRSGSTPSSGTGPSSTDEGSTYIYMEASNSNHPNKDAIIFSPCFNLTSMQNPEFSFSYHMLGSPGILRLEASTDGVSWTQIWSISGNQGSNWLRDTVNLQAYNQATVLRLRFFGTTGSGWQGDICVDAVKIEEPVAPCLPPTNLTLNNILPTSVDFNWTASPSASSYTLRYQIQGHNNWTTVNNITGTSYTATGLTPNRTYEWELSSTCGAGAAGSQVVSGPVFNTPQLSNCTQLINTFPYVNSFENNLGWNNVWGDDFNWLRRTGNTPSSGTGPSGASDRNYYAYMEVSFPHYPQKVSWLESPCFDLSQLQNPEISFQFHMLGLPGTLRLEVSNDGFVWTQVWSVSGNQGSNWQTATVNLANYAASNDLRFRFNGTSGNSWRGDMCIDDIRVGSSLPACSAPTNLQVSNVLASSATLSWDSVPGAVSYALQYREKGMTTWIFVGGITSTSYNVTGLFTDSAYEWRVESNCGNQLMSPSENGPDFVPQQVLNCVYTIPFFPFATDFESSLGWFNDINDDFDWTRMSGSTPSVGTGPSDAAQGSYYAYLEVSNTNHPQKTAILYSPCFNLINTNDLHISFSYHMLGSPGILRLEASTDGTSWAQIWSKTGNQGSLWLSDTVDLSNYSTASGLRLRFRGTSGSTWQGDICIDNIVLFEMPQTISPDIEGELLAEEPAQAESIRIAPNPFTDRLDILLQYGEIQEASISIFSLSGKKVWEEKRISLGGRTSIYPDIATGMYIVRIQAGTLEKEMKLVKTK